MQKSLWVSDAAASDVTEPSPYPLHFDCPVQSKEWQSQSESHTHTLTHTLELGIHSRAHTHSVSHFLVRVAVWKRWRRRRRRSGNSRRRRPVEIGHSFRCCSR